MWLTIAICVISPRDKTLIENVQKFGLRICAKQWDLGYNKLSSNFAVSTLQSRRLKHKLSSMFKIVHNLIVFPPSIFVYLARVELALMPIFNLLPTQTLSCILLFLPLFRCGIHYLVIFLALLHFLYF